MSTAGEGLEGRLAAKAVGPGLGDGACLSQDMVRWLSQSAQVIGTRARDGHIPWCPLAQPLPALPSLLALKGREEATRLRSLLWLPQAALGCPHSCLGLTWAALHPLLSGCPLFEDPPVPSTGPSPPSLLETVLKQAAPHYWVWLPHRICSLCSGASRLPAFLSSLHCPGASGPILTLGN